MLATTAQGLKDLVRVVGDAFLNRRKNKEADMRFTAITSAQAQTPRGESEGALAQDAESALGFLAIFAAIAIFSAYKRSKQEGTKALGLCVALALLVAFVPKVGMVVVGALGLIIAWGLFRQFM